MKELFIYRIQQAEKPSKKEKYIRKVAGWIIIDIVLLSLAASIYTEVAKGYTVEIVRSVVRPEAEAVDQAHEIAEAEDGVGVDEEGGQDTRQALQIIKKVAKEEGIDWKVLYAIGQKESQYEPNRVGDTHLPHPSVGYFQINTWYHKEVTREQANDLEWSARWTAKRLKKNEWRGESEMIRSHNGLVADHHNDSYVDDVKKIIESL